MAAALARHWQALDSAEAEYCHVIEALPGPGNLKTKNTPTPRNGLDGWGLGEEKWVGTSYHDTTFRANVPSRTSHCSAVLKSAWLIYLVLEADPLLGWVTVSQSPVRASR